MSLELRNLSVDLGGHRIVSDVTLRVPTGCFAGLLGPNGSGKSTILKTIYRLNRPAAGVVLIDDLDLCSLSPRQTARRIAVVSQDNHVEFDITVDEMVMLGRYPHKGPFERDSERDRHLVSDALDLVGCAPLARRSYHSLSGGEQQRVQVARALAQEADHLVLDEPTNHLDIRYQAEILELVAQLGVTVLAALHDLGLASLFCDEVHLLSEGRPIVSGPPSEVVTVTRVSETYGADVLVIAHPETGAPQVLARRADPHKPPIKSTNPET